MDLRYPCMLRSPGPWHLSSGSSAGLLTYISHYPFNISSWKSYRLIGLNRSKRKLMIFLPNQLIPQSSPTQSVVQISVQLLSWKVESNRRSLPLPAAAVHQAFLLIPPPKHLSTLSIFFYIHCYHASLRISVSHLKRWHGLSLSFLGHL